MSRRRSAAVPGSWRGSILRVTALALVALVAGAAGCPLRQSDREASPGVKFADADLLGMPVQLVSGGKGLARGVVERKVRATGERDELPLQDVAGRLD